MIPLRTDAFRRFARASCAMALLVAWALAEAGVYGITDQLPPKQDYAGGAHALIIANSAYQHESVWPALPGVVVDAARVKKALESLGFVVDLKSDLTTKELRDAISGFYSEQPGETDRLLLLYYAGHGQAIKDGPNDAIGYLVGVDAAVSGNSREVAGKSLYPITDLKSPVEGAAARHQLIVLDSCFGGAVFDTGVENFARAEPGEAMRGAVFENKAVRFLTSGERDERVMDESAFAEAFVSGIQGVADNDASGFVTASELGVFVRAVVQSRTSGFAIEQNPSWGFLKVGDGRPGEPRIRTPGGRGQGLPSAAASLPFRDPNCPLCPEIVQIPAGRIADPAGNSVVLSQRLFVSVHEITLEEWDACWAHQACKRALPGAEGQRSRVPVSGVSWLEANEFTRWLSSISGKNYRLPNDTEWAYFARALPAVRYPWGELWDDGKEVHCRDCPSGVSNKPIAVGTFKPNAFGLFDVLGNVWEWTSECGPVGTVSAGTLACASHTRVIRGGSYATPAALLTLDLRDALPEANRFPTVGFRVVRD